MAERLTIVSAERIQAELSKLLTAEDPTPGLELIVDTGLADRFLPELPALQLEQDPVHRHKDVLRHTMVVVATCRSSDLVLRLAALLHDVGKPATRQFTADGVQFPPPRGGRGNAWPRSACARFGTRTTSWPTCRS
jgi:poly(A) polymerase